MAASIVQYGCFISCPHGGSVIVISSQTRVRLSGSPAILPGDATTVAGCPFSAGSTPHPCVSVTWSGAAERVLINHQGPLLETSIGVCKSAEGTPQGSAILSGVQRKALAE